MVDSLTDIYNVLASEQSFVFLMLDVSSVCASGTLRLVFDNEVQLLQKATGLGSHRAHQRHCHDHGCHPGCHVPLRARDLWQQHRGQQERHV